MGVGDGIAVKVGMGVAGLGVDVGRRARVTSVDGGVGMEVGSTGAMTWPQPDRDASRHAPHTAVARVRPTRSDRGPKCIILFCVDLVPKLTCKPSSVLPNEPEETVIYLGQQLPAASSGQPEVGSRANSGRLPDLLLFGLAPGGVYLAGPVTWIAGGLLHRRFTLTGLPVEAGGPAVCFLLHSAVGSPRLDVIQHPALWSSDFPRAMSRARPSGLLGHELL